MATTAESGSVLDGAITRARWRILPFLVLMYVMAFVDRSNVGFAKTALQADTGISNAAFALGASIFFVGYAIFEVPSNIILYRVGARIWLSRIMFTWGIVAACMALTQGAASFYALRFLLGLAEAGFFPGIILYLTLWFPRRIRSQTVGIFYFGFPLSLIFGGPLSGILLDMSPPFGLAPWQFMFIVEGLMTSAVGIVAFFYLTDRPADAAWLSAAQRDSLTAAMRTEDSDKLEHGPRSIGGALASPRILAFCLIYFTVQIAVYGVVFYLPTAIAGLMGGHVGTAVGFVTAIPCITAIIATFFLTRLADRTGRHRQIASTMLVVAALGIAASVMSNSLPLAVVAFCFAAGGFVSVQPLFWALPTSYLGGAAAASGIGLINSIGNLGGFVAPNLKNFVEQTSGNAHLGMFTLALSALIGAVLLLTLGQARRPAGTTTSGEMRT